MENTEALPQPTKAQSTSELENSAAVKSAVNFLKDPRVKHTPADRKISFLKGKGLSAEEIQYAFSKAGQPPVTIEQIVGTRTQQPQSNVAAPPRATTTPSQFLFPPSMPPPPEPEETLVDWRDVVIGVGAAVLGGFGAYKLFTNYSPFEIRRKGPKRPTASRGDGRRRGGGRNYSSESEADSVPSPAGRRVPPLPAAPVIPEPSTNANEEMEKLKAELAETKEALDAERKKAASLAVSAAKVRGEKQQLIRTNDKLSQELEEVRQKLEEYEKEKEKEGAKDEKPTEADAPKTENTDDEEVEKYLSQLGAPAEPTAEESAAPPQEAGEKKEDEAAKDVTKEAEKDTEAPKEPDTDKTEPVEAKEPVTTEEPKAEEPVKNEEEGHHISV